jgi:DNA topoisomerase IA
MTTNLKRGVWVLAVAVGIGVSAGTVQAVASPIFQDHEQQREQQHEQDYSKYKTYQQGMREGKADHMHNMDHSKKRHFKKDEDNKAYEAGYQKGRHD